MTYLTPADLAALKAADQRIETGILRVTDFTDLSDRTLTLGISGQESEPEKNLFEHIYLEGGQLRRHSYKMEGSVVYTQAQTASEGIHVLLLRPNLGVAPSATDLEFAKLMAEFQHSLNFFELGGDEDEALAENRADGKFFGWRQKYYFENGSSTLY